MIQHRNTPLFFVPLLLAIFFAFSTQAESAFDHRFSHSHWVIIHKVTLGHSIRWAIGSTRDRLVTLKTDDGGRHWADVSPHGFWPQTTAQASGNTPEEFNEAEDDGSAVSFFDTNSGAVANVATDKDGNAVAVHVASTTTGGRHWLLTQFRVPEWVDSVDFQIIDARHGILLALSSPAAGLMKKRVYQTCDGSRNWQLVSNSVARDDSFYPIGIIFRSPLDGWIAATYHGRPDVPIFRTDNGGKTWHLQSLPEPAVYQNGGYGNTNPPHFFDPQRREGTLVVNYRNNDINRFETITYVTRDDGQTWRIGKRKRIKEQR